MTNDSSRELVVKLVEGVKTSLAGLFGDTGDTVNRLVSRLARVETTVAVLRDGFDTCKRERTEDIAELKDALLTRRPIWHYLLTLLPVGAMLTVGVKLLVDFGSMRTRVEMHSAGFAEASKMMRSTQRKLDSLLVILSERERRNP